MSNTHLLRDDRESTPRRSRMPVAFAGAAVLAMSLLLSVAPVLGAAKNDTNGGGGGTGSSNVKVHDASTGVEALGGDNEPHVCDFWLEFSMPDPYEAGTWVLVSWAPTGDGSTVASGTYDTAGDGTDASSVIHVWAGHYRVEWTATGATVTKKKTFWVDSTCGETTSPVEATPPVEPLGSVTESVPESPAEESVTESVPESPADQSAAEEPADSADESPVEESPIEEPSTAAETDEQVVLSGLGSGDESVVEEPAPPADETVVDEVVNEEPTTDDAVSPPTDDAAAEEPVEAQDPGTPPAQDQLDGHHGPGGSTMPDTAGSTLPAASGLVATLGLLSLIVLHAATRRSRRTDRE